MPRRYATFLVGMSSLLSGSRNRTGDFPVVMALPHAKDNTKNALPLTGVILMTFVSARYRSPNIHQGTYFDEPHRFI